MPTCGCLIGVPREAAYYILSYLNTANTHINRRISQAKGQLIFKNYGDLSCQKSPYDKVGGYPGGYTDRHGITEQEHTPLSTS